MSQHRKNKDVKQSPLDPDMENEADQIADTLVSETLDRAAGNINELMQSISRWETEEHSKSAADHNKDASSVACCTNQKLGQELHRFFNMRRVFAEHREQDVTEEDLVTEMDAGSSNSKNMKPSEMSISSSKDISVTVKADKTQTSSKSDTKKDGQTGKYNRFLKSAGKRVTFFTKKSGNKVHPAPDQHEEEAAKSSSHSSSPPQKASSVTVCSRADIRTTTKSDLSTIPLELVDVDYKDENVTPEEFMEEDLVTDMDGCMDVVGSATSDSPSKDIETKPIEMSPTASASASKDISVTVEADKTQTSSKSDSKKERQTGRYARFFCNTVKSTGKSATLFRKKRENKGHPVPDQHEEEVAESSIQSSSPPQEASSLTSVRSSDDIRTAAKSDLSTVPLERVDVDNKDQDVTTEEFMGKDLVTAMDVTPGTSQVQQGSEYVDEVVGSATSDSPSKDIETKPIEMSPTASTSASEDISVTVEADKTQTSSKSDSKKDRQTRRYTRFFCNTVKSTGKSATVFGKKSGNKGYPVPDQHKEEVAESSIQSSSLPQEASFVILVRSAAAKSDLSIVPLERVDADNKDQDVTTEEFMEEDLVTDMDATLGTSQVQLGAEHVDEVVGSATSDSPSKDIETKPIEMSPTASTSSNEDISVTVEADKTQTSPKSDKERQTGRYARFLYKTVKSAGKSVTKLFRKKSGDKGYPAPDQHEEEVAESSSNSSSPPQETSSLTSVRSSDDIRTAANSDLSTVPLELVDVDNKDQDLTLEEFMEEDLVTDMDATPGTSQVQLGAEHVDEVGSATSDSPSKDIETKSIEMSPTASTSASKDISVTVEADRTQISSESDSKHEIQTERYTSFLCKVKSVGKSVTKLFRRKSGNTGHPAPDQHEKEAAESSSQSSSPTRDLVTDMNATPGTSQTKPSGMSPTASTENISDTAEADRTQTSSESDSKTERQTGRGTSVVIQRRKFMDFFRKNKIHPIPEEEDDASDSQSTPSSSSPQVASTPTHVHSSEDMNTAVKACPSHAPLVLVDVDDEDIVSEPLPIRSSPAAGHCEDMVMDRYSTPGPSGQDKHPQPSQKGSRAAVQLHGLKHVFYIIIKEFYGSLTDEQLEEIKRGVYNMDVKEQIIDMGMEVLRHSIEAITYALSQAINQSSAPQYGTMRSPTCSEECNTEQVGQNLPSELVRESFAITDDDIRTSLKSSLGMAFCDVLRSDRTIKIPPKLTATIVKTVTDELNSLLSETIQASLDEVSSIVPTATCCQFSSCRRCKEMLMGVVTRMKFWLTFQDIARNQRYSDPHTDNSRFVTASDSKDPKKTLLWWSCLIRWWRRESQIQAEQVVDSSGDSRSLTPETTSTSSSAENGDTMSEESRNSPPPHSTGYFPPANLEDNTTISDYPESPSVAETQYSDSSAESSNGVCQVLCKGKSKKEEMAASTQEDTIQTKKHSLLKIIWKCCCCLCCCCCNDALE
ncbi:serine-rich adhesin for platelets-like [Thunnus thynnus]|uniref:serine-rich adhesin for platelets-like n=1 Tax=Thunnus thynnus TaxID=8237 RepID=UPI003529AA6B